jgi:hypothetical protein
MSLGKYKLPDFLLGQCPAEIYHRWLHRKAVAHVRRDRRRGNTQAAVAAYKAAIHAAVVDSGGRDVYTGRALQWNLISRYKNLDSKAGGRWYKQKFSDLPTVDHVSDNIGRPEFRICSWRTNDAKGDLSIDDFLALCFEVVAHARKAHHRGQRQKKTMKKRRLPPGWTEKRIRALAAYHNKQTIEQQVAEIEAALDDWNKLSNRVRVKWKGEASDGRP